MSVKMNVVRRLLKLRKDNMLKKQSKQHFNSLYDILEINNNFRNSPAVIKKIALRYLKVEKKEISGVNCLLIKPNLKTKHFSNTPNNQDILFFYIHGGGFVNGFMEQGAYFIKAISRRIGCSAISVDYTLSPEVTYPYALNQIYNVYLEIIKQYKPNKIILGGESAGGNFCLALLQKLRDENIKMPKVVIISSGYLDLTNQGPSYTQNEESDVTLSKNQTPYMSSAYILGNKLECPTLETLKNPYVSPIYASFKNFPPIFFSVCSDELLYSDTLTAYENCKRDGVKAVLHENKNCFHAYMALGDVFEEGKIVNNEAAKFIKSVMRLEKINLID